jgi:ribosome-associated heat shock protein Hsp15
MTEQASVRLDVWLWAARFFKTRSLAKQAIEAGRVLIDGQRGKPARALRGGERLLVQRGDERIEVEILKLSQRRGGAPEAQALYAETPLSQARRAKEAEERKLLRAAYSPPPGRPDKRDRRRLIAFVDAQQAAEDGAQD